MRTRFMRLLTLAVMIAACGWAFMQGVGYVRYEMAREIAEADPRETGALASWTRTPGLASTALDALLHVPANNGDPESLRQRADMLERLLVIKPGGSQAWLSLAAVRSQLALPQDRIDAAFTMSGLTGPAEGAVMLERSLLGVLIWERSSPAVRARTAIDLCGLSLFDPARIRLVMTTKTDAVRAEIRSSLEAGACSPKTIAIVGL